MITQSQYVAHSGLSKGRVSQLVSAGMPLDSVEACDAFRNLGPIRSEREARLRRLRAREGQLLEEWRRLILEIDVELKHSASTP